MFLNSDIVEQAQEVTTSQKNEKQQVKRYAANRFQAKKKEETPKVQETNEEKPVSRINQKEQQMMQQVKQPEPETKQIESLVQFDSDEDDDAYKLEESNRLQMTQKLVQKESALTYQEKLQALQQQREKTLKEQQNSSLLQNNSQYIKKLGQNQSSYEERDLEIQKLTVIGNNHNQYYEPGQNFNDFSSEIPQLKKLSTKIITDHRQQEKQQMNQNPIQEIEQENRQELIMQNDQREYSSNELIIDDDHPNEQLLQEQAKEEDLKKELKQVYEKVQMAESHQLEQEQVEEQEQEQYQDQQPIIQQKQPEEQPKQSCPYPRPLIEIPMPYGKKHFLLNPPPKGGMIQCTIKRDRSGMSRFYPKYHMHISNGFLYLMSAKKRAINNTSNYIVSLAREDMQKKENYIGKVRSNFMGTEFILYDQGQNPKKCKDPNQIRQQLGVVYYESNILGTKGPRKMIVTLPKVDEASNQMHIYKPNSSKEGILADFRTKNEKDYVICQNRPPQWNSKHKAFVLNFYQRVDKPSVKNFQLVFEKGEDNILLQFGRVGDDLFNLDFQWPITPLQAFEIALTSFDYKIACE